jgi:NADH dehydrogenase FAD-containing subunit
LYYLIDKNPYHQLLQQIHTVAAGIKKQEEITFSIKELFDDELTFVQGSVQCIEPLSGCHPLYISDQL